MALLKKKADADSAAEEKGGVTKRGSDETAVKKSRGLTLRRKPAVTDPSAPVQMSHPRVPPASFNMMTVRYAIEQRRSLAVIALVGVLAIAVVLLLGRWVTLTSSEADVRQDIRALEEEAVLINEQLTKLADTGGLNPNEVDRLRTQRLQVLTSILSGEINYQKLVSDIVAMDSSRAWVTSIDFSGASESGGLAIRVSGRAVDRIDVDNWYTAAENTLPYGRILEEWPSYSGTPGDSSGGIQWTATIETDNTVFLDRMTELGFEVQQGKASQGDSNSGASEDESTTTTVPEGDE